jgi:hypothetical protein
MSRCVPLRLALALFVAATLLPAAAFAQSQDTQSVADAARRARDEKKPPAKPAKVITDDDLKPAVPAGAATPAVPGAPAAPGTPPFPNANPPANGSSPVPDAKDQKESKEITDLKAQIKQLMGELDQLLREQSLDKDSFYSNTDYAHDTAGKAKLDELQQQIGGKQLDLDHLKAHLAELLSTQDTTATAPPPRTP